ETDTDTQALIVVPASLDMVTVLGSGDENIRVVERGFPTVDVHVRGNRITLSGPPAEVALLDRVVGEMLAVVRTGQALTAIGMGLRGLTTRVENGDKNRANQTLRQLQELTAHSLNELQRLIGDLRPSHLDDLGLPAALRWYAHDIQERAQIYVRVEINGKERPVSSAVKTALFRIAQEALTNVVKHANARNASINLSYGPNAVRVQVTDDGRGFDTRSMTSSERISWGLTGMQERATLLGGKFALSSRSGEGTKIEVSIPYQEDVEVSDENTSPVGG
ncbi:MAG: hypothetical protein KKC71_08050, partial [Chloroflexi bacterium]|nr:hypothetical protein [Chloroflexota bacterium]